MSPKCHGEILGLVPVLDQGSHDDTEAVDDGAKDDDVSHHVELRQQVIVDVDVEEGVESLLHSNYEIDVAVLPPGDEEEEDEADDDGAGLEHGAGHPEVGVQLPVQQTLGLQFTDQFIQFDSFFLSHNFSSIRDISNWLSCSSSSESLNVCKCRLCLDNLEL